MTDIKITFQPSLSKLASKFKGIKLQGFLQTKITELAFLVEGEAKQVTPVDTGRLRASIRVLTLSRPLDRIVKTHTNYAVYVHEGTRYMRGRPFMYWGAQTATQGLERRLSKELDSHIQAKIK